MFSRYSLFAIVAIFSFQSCTKTSPTDLNAKKIKPHRDVRAVLDGGNDALSGTVAKPDRPSVGPCGPMPDRKDFEDFEKFKTAIVLWYECVYKDTIDLTNTALRCVAAVHGLSEYEPPNPDYSKLICNACKSDDAVSYLKCLNEKILYWVGENNCGEEPGKLCCRHFAPIFESVADTCGLKSSTHLVLPPGYKEGHVWNFVELDGQCFIVDALNQIVEPVPCQ